ncbi:hypothetical protein AB6809_11450 [Paraburkholderia sp. RCC_158]
MAGIIAEAFCPCSMESVVCGGRRMQTTLNKMNDCPLTFLQWEGVCREIWFFREDATGV